MRLCSGHIFPWLDSSVTLWWSRGHRMWNKSPSCSHQLILWISAMYWAIYRYLLCCFYSACVLWRTVPALREACHSTRVPMFIVQFSSVQSLSHIRLFATPWTTACQTSLSITNSGSLPKLMSIESVMPSNHLILCLALPLLPSIFPNIRVFSNESALHIRWPEYWSFSFNIRLRVWEHLEQTGTAPFPALSPIIMSEQHDTMERKWMGRNTARRKEKKKETGREEELDPLHWWKCW